MNEIDDIPLSDLKAEEAALSEKAKSDTLTLAEANRLAKVRSVIHRIESVANRINWD